MAYFDREDQLSQTLKSIQKSEYKDFEVIIVNDGGPLLTKHILPKININLITILPKNKTHVNSCIPYNIGFKAAKGDIIIIQNPECLHVGDILKAAETLCNNKNYISFACYSIDQENTEKISQLDINNIWRRNNRPVKFDGDNGWYNHPQHRSVNYHFCTAITQKNLHELGGFDETYADGLAYEDNELLFRIRQKGLNIIPIGYPFVIHQWHYTPKNIPNSKELMEKNHQRYLKLTEG